MSSVFFFLIISRVTCTIQTPFRHVASFFKVESLLVCKFIFLQKINKVEGPPPNPRTSHDAMCLQSAQTIIYQGIYCIKLPICVASCLRRKKLEQQKEIIIYLSFTFVGLQTRMLTLATGVHCLLWQVRESGQLATLQRPPSFWTQSKVGLIMEALQHCANSRVLSSISCPVFMKCMLSIESAKV